MIREQVSFKSGGVPCAGVLHLPERSAGPTPCVLLAHGVSGTMDRLFAQAQAFAGAGFAALVFDYRGFGASGGDPRQVLTVPGQQDDIRAAVAWLRTRAEVDPDRMALWGNSLGGAHVITVASSDPRIGAVVAQIPFNGFPRTVEGRSTATAMRLFALMISDTARGKLGMAPRYLPMIGKPGELAVVATDDARKHLETLAGDAGSWRNEIAPRGLLQMMRYHPEKDAARLTAPLLVCVAENDTATPPDLAARLAQRASRGTVLTYPGDHFDFYATPSIRRRVLEDQVAFLRGHLLGVPVTSS